MVELYFTRVDSELIYSLVVQPLVNIVMWHNSVKSFRVFTKI